MIDSIIIASISVIIPIIVVLVIRNCMIYRVSKKILKFFWIIMICRLLVPVFVPLDFLGPFNINRSISRVVLNNYSVEILEDFNKNIAGDFNSPRLNSVSLDSVNSLDGTAKDGIKQRPYGFEGKKILTFVWCFGFFVVAFFISVRHILFIRKCKEAIPISLDYRKIKRVSEYLNQIKIRREIKINQFDEVSVPLTFGIIRPVVIIPKIFLCDEKLLEFSLLHELTHIKRLDVLVKLLLAISICIHWFNPFVWLMYFFVDRDIELACDEEVSDFLGEDNKKDYAISLIDITDLNKSDNFLTSSYAKFFLEERCVSIMKSKKSILLTFVLILSVVFLSTQAFAYADFNEKLALEEEDRRLNDANELKEDYSEILVQIDEETMEKKVSLDRGKSWLKDEDADVLVNQDEIEPEYWTAGEFEIWLKSFLDNNNELYEEGQISKEEKEYNIKFYSEMLEEIKKGALYTKDSDSEQMEFNMNDYLQGKSK
ncbi:M56 family metallopeptidase [Finegoldia magna]|uniref:M56 family metallopeptidase n=1 Tax=Finegoldia magna TaxID=1260 RepID=UPI00288A1A99|nr:M56 family metallopeptidase [Finegoldia magna]